MPGLFDSFENLDLIPEESIARWLKPKPDFTYIQNYLAQRILYPQTVPISDLDMKIDLAILREVLRALAPHTESPMLGDNPFLNQTLRKIMIPEKFLAFVPSLSMLVWAFIDGLLLERKKKDFFEDLWTIVLTGETDETVGSLFLPEFKSEHGILQLRVLGRIYEIPVGGLVVIPCPYKRREVAFKLKDGEFLGKKDLSVEVYGGKLGLVVDARKVKK